VTIMRIARLDKINGFRAFQNWHDDGTSASFGRVNIIYGSNGSGKSTLAQLFQMASIGTLGGEANFEFQGSVDGNPITITKESTAFWRAVRVFNQYYVDENLRFDEADGPTPGSLLTLGEQNVANEVKLEENRRRRITADTELTEAKSALVKATRRLEQKLSAVASAVVAELARSGVPRYRATNVYNKTKVQERLASKTQLSTASPEDISVALQLALSTKPEEMTVPRSPTSPSGSLADKVSELLARSVSSVVLEELRDPTQARWVQQGISLHKDLDTCLFCGAVIETARRHALDEHFDDALIRLQADIDSVVEELDAILQGHDAFIRELTAAKSSYPDVQASFAEAREAYKSSDDAYCDQLSEFKRLLSEKRNSPFREVIHAPFVLTPPSPSGVTEKLNEHDTRASKHIGEVAIAAEQVELAKVEAARSEYNELAEAARKLQKKVTDLQREVRELSDTIASFENVESDPVPKAGELTQHVARLLGRSELVFEMDVETKRYRLFRNGLPATHLSEGERTAIALLHFLMGVRKDSISGDEPVLVIDDPVSSLDDSILFGASAFLWAELVTVEYASQVFLLTHKFELFRQWLIQIESAGRFMRDGNSVQEIRMKHEPDRMGEIRRTPRLHPWTTDKKMSRRLRSQYHFLFAKVASVVIEARDDIGLAERMDLLALAPNAARKMLEAFLSFRHPSLIGDFHGGMRAALADIKDAATRTHIERYLHAYSHNEEGDISSMLDPSEVRPVIQSLFEMIRTLDEGHFEAMCASLEIDSAEITR
jgi:wobble nucleotide-excising tRNase